jgi:hypothetical protein
MPTLLSLSEELLVRVVNFVEYRSLASLSRVSQTLNRLTTPQLYDTIDFEGASEDTGVTNLIPLTFHLLQNPEIASLVHSFSIRNQFGTEGNLDDLAPTEGDEVNDDDVLRKGWPQHPDLDSIIRKAVEDVEDGEEEKETLFENVRNGTDEGAVLAILLPKLTNLRKLDLVHGYLGPGSYLTRLLHKVTKREGPFQEEPAFINLTDVLIAGYDDKYPNEPAWFGAYLELPSIRRLHGYQLGNNEQESITETMAELGTGTSPVEEIELRESQLYAEDLERVLRACSKLKTFIYEVGHAWAWYTLRTSDIIHSMQPTKDTLEQLVLTHPDYPDDGEDDDFSGVTLANFPKLRYLKISSLFLGGTHQGDNQPKPDLMGTFPSCLEILHVTYVGDSYPNPGTTAALQRVIEQSETVFPSLRRLILEGSFVKHPNRLEDIKGMIEIANGKGIATGILTDEDVNDRDWDKREERPWGISGEIEWKECFANQKGNVAILETRGSGWEGSADHLNDIQAMNVSDGDESTRRDQEEGKEGVESSS